MNVDVLSDRTTGIRASVHHVQIELVLAVVLVVLVIFAFLHSPRATLIASLAVPISLVGTCGAMYLLGYSLNNLSLMALTIATGFVVDDAIVMIENISRHIEDGEPPLAAALKGASEIGFTIISLTVSLIAVLIPLLFMGDVVGRLFREFAVTLAITILISAVVSLTLVPMMSARWLTRAPGRRDRLGRPRCSAASTAWSPHYDRWLRWVLARQGLDAAGGAGHAGLTVLLYLWIPKGLFPTQDTGQLQARVEAPQSVSYARMASLQREVAQRLMEDPDVATITSFVGVDGANNTMLHTGRMLINLEPGHDPQQALMERLRRSAQQVPGVTLYLQPTQDLTIDAESGPTQYRVSLEGADTAGRRRMGWQARAAVADGTPTAQRPDRCAGGRRGGVGADRPRHGRAPGHLGRRDRRGAVQRVRPAHRLDHLHRDQPVPRDPGGAPRRRGQPGEPGHGAVAHGLRRGRRRCPRWRPSPSGARRCRSRTWRSSRRRPSASTPRRASRSARAVDAIRDAAEDVALPAGVTMTFLGAAGAYQASLTNQLWLILAAVVCVYIVLGVLYESYIHPLTILSTLPSAGVGALLALMAGGQRPRRDRHHRHHPADRHRQEERDHDDRLRARRGAPAGQVAARGDPPGCAAALPADPDDDAGRAVRRRAADARLGRRRRAAPAAGPRDLRRADA